MKNARAGEETVVDVELDGTMMPRGSRSGGERSDPERRDPLGPPMVGVVSRLTANERCPEPAEGLKQSSHSKKNSRRCWGSPWIKRKTKRHADSSN